MAHVDSIKTGFEISCASSSVVTRPPIGKGLRCFNERSWLVGCRAAVTERLWGALSSVLRTHVPKPRGRVRFLSCCEHRGERAWHVGGHFDRPA